MTDRPLSHDAARLLRRLQELDRRPGANALDRITERGTSPPSSTLSRPFASGTPKVLIDGVLDRQLNELAAAELISTSATSVELTDRGRGANADASVTDVSLAERALSYARRNYVAAAIGAAMTAVAVFVAVVTLVADDGTGGDESSPTDRDGNTADEAPASPSTLPIAESLDIGLLTNPDEILRRNRSEPPTSPRFPSKRYPTRRAASTTASAATSGRAPSTPSTQMSPTSSCR